MSIFLYRSHSSLPRGRGFTLIELLLVLAVMTLLTGIFLFQQSRFDSSTLLRSLAYSVALSVRQAQVYGTSVRAFEGTFDKSYGIYVQEAVADSYVLFADINQNGTYDSGEEIKTFKLGSKFIISDFCVTQGATESCQSDGSIDHLAIWFSRPDPDANFETEDGVNYSQARIQLMGAGGTTRSVIVTLPGQISVGAVGS